MRIEAPGGTVEISTGTVPAGPPDPGIFRCRANCTRTIKPANSKSPITAPMTTDRFQFGGDGGGICAGGGIAGPGGLGGDNGWVTKGDGVPWVGDRGGAGG